MDESGYWIRDHVCIIWKQKFLVFPVVADVTLIIKYKGVILTIRNYRNTYIYRNYLAAANIYITLYSDSDILGVPEKIISL